jgi:hypothetical protein
LYDPDDGYPPDINVLTTGSKKELESFLGAYQQRHIAACHEFQAWWAHSDDMTCDAWTRKSDELGDRWEVCGADCKLDGVSFKIVPVWFEDDGDDEPVDAPAPRLPATA